MTDSTSEYLPYNAMQSILDETIRIGRTNETDLQLKDVQLRLYTVIFLGSIFNL